MFKNFRCIFRVNRRVPGLEHYFLQNSSLFSSTLRPISATVGSQDTDTDQFTVSYLVNSCGLSLESAILASKRVRLKNPEKPDAFLSLLKSYKFSQAQISKLIKQCPRLLLSKPEKTVLPKLEFLRSKGLSDPEISKLVSSCPTILDRSLNNTIVPNYDYLKGVLQSEEKAIVALGRNSFYFSRDVKTLTAQTIKIFRENGVPELGIQRLVLYWPTIFKFRSDRVHKILEEAREMGFDPSKSRFFEAVGSLASMKKSTWESKVDVFRRWNLTKEQVLAGLRKSPTTMRVSKKKITAIMEVLVDRLGLEPLVVVKNAWLLGLSLENRVLPRASVLLYLVSKGLVKKESLNPSMFLCNEEKFLVRFVSCYPEDSELLKLYGAKLELSR